jgi:hypothetical protein
VDSSTKQSRERCEGPEIVPDCIVAFHDLQWKVSGVMFSKSDPQRLNYALLLGPSWSTNNNCTVYQKHFPTSSRSQRTQSFFIVYSVVYFERPRDASASPACSKRTSSSASLAAISFRASALFYHLLYSFHKFMRCSLLSFISQEGNREKNK